MSLKGKVYVFNIYAGTIEETDEGKYLFIYDQEYINRPNAKPVSLTLPLNEQPYSSNLLFSFFDGLIPEGWILDLTIKNWKLDPRNRMELLLKACRDCIGSVHIMPENEQDNEV